MKRLNRVVLTSSGSWHETISKCSLHEEHDTQKTSILKFWLLAEDDGGKRQCYDGESSLKVPIYVVYTKKQGYIILGDESASFSKGILYWEESGKIGNFLYFCKGDTDYDVISATVYGKKAMILIGHVIKLLAPVLPEDTLENHAAQALISEGGDAGEGAETGMGA